MTAARLRRLERAAACFRAEAAFSPIAEEYADQCHYAIEDKRPFPDFLEFIRTSPRPRVPLLAGGPVRRYIERCAEKRVAPEPVFLTLYYVHGYAITYRLHHPNPKYRCRCGTLLYIPPITSCA